MRTIPVLLSVSLLASCAASPPGGRSGAEPGAAPAPPGLPPSADDATARLNASPRHGEWASVAAGGGDSVRAWIVYPERPDPAPVVVVVHEIFGLTHWVRAVADQLAADGFIAVAPDLLSGHGVPWGPDGEPDRDAAVAAIRGLAGDEVHRRVEAAATHAMRLPGARAAYGVVGYCWGGTVAFEHAALAPQRLGAAVVFYGSSPATERLQGVRAPVLGLYAGDDARVNATIAPADSALRALGRTFEPRLFPGAGHGFLRAQEGRDGANRAASVAAWPQAVRWLRTHLGG
jgi:carboxymethylenebutenolidase